MTDHQTPTSGVPSPPTNPKRPPTAAAEPPPPRRSQQPVSPPRQGSDGIDIVAALMKWVGPAFIVLGMIYGAVFLVETNVFGPPERLVAGIAVTLGFGWLGQYFIRRGQKLLGELVTGTFFAGAFLCSWAVPAVTGWPIGTSVLLSGGVGLLALAYSWMRNDSTGFAMGIVGLAGIPISGPLYSDAKFLSTVEDLYGESEMIVPLVLFAVLAFGLRAAKGWFLPWALSIAALTTSLGYTIDGGGSLGAQLLMTGVIAGSALLGVVRTDVDDDSLAQRFLSPLFGLIDAVAPVFALLPVWALMNDMNLSVAGERLTMGIWAGLTIGLALTLYRGVEQWGIKRSQGRTLGGLLSAFFALLIALGDLNWYVYVVMLAAAFVVSIVSDSGSQASERAGERQPLWTLVLQVVQIVLGAVTAIGLLFMILTGLTGPLAESVPTLVSAWAAAGLFALGFYLRADLRDWWAVPYSIALGLLAASIGGSPTMLIVTSAGWLLAGFGAVKFGLNRQERTALGVGLATVAVALGKFLLVDTPQADGNLTRAVSFLVAGLVIVLLSADSTDIRRVLRQETSTDDRLEVS